MKVIEAKGAILGRVASYAAKEALKGEDIAVINCKDILISGNKKTILEGYRQKRRRTGTGFRGPKFPRTEYMIVKRTIRGMLPHHQSGRGRVAMKRIKCYNDTPLDFEKSEKIILEQRNPLKTSKIGEVTK